MNYGKYYNLSRYYAETGEPLSANVQAYRKKLSDIGALDLSDEKIRDIFPDQIWQYAVTANINLFPEDLEYTENVIKKDKKFKLIDLAYVPGLDAKQIDKILILHYEHFYNDINCPKQLKKILDVMIIKGKKLLPPRLGHDFVVDVFLRNFKEKLDNGEITPKKPVVPGHDYFATEFLRRHYQKQSQI